MAMSISGAVLSGLGSPILISGGKRSGIGGGAFMRVGRKNVIIARQRKKSWVPTAVEGDGNSKLDPTWLDDASWFRAPEKTRSQRDRTPAFYLKKMAKYIGATEAKEAIFPPKT